ncbi:hypothetical protein HKD37_11G031602 [Glycine soja]
MVYNHNLMEQSNISDLNINDEVDMEFNLEEAGENAIDLSLCLEGRFLTNIHIRVPIMKERMVEVWKPICGITIDELKPPVFLFCFYHIVDIQNVLKGGPWNFDKDSMENGGNGKDDAECRGSIRYYFKYRSRQGPISKLFAVRWKDILDSDVNYHNIVVYNKDLDQLAIVAKWTTLRDFYQLTGDHLVSLTHYVSNFVTFKVYLTQQKVSCNNLDVLSSMYYFLKDKGLTHLHLEDVAEYRLVFNHWRKTLKIGAGWKHFFETLSLTTDMEIVFEFIDPTVNLHNLPMGFMTHVVGENLGNYIGAFIEDLG